MKHIFIIESFISWQGEGLHTGKRVLILRYKNCNRRCIFCDTSVKMRVSKEFEFSFKEIQNIVNEEKCGILLTGGEPTFNLNLSRSIDLINNINCSFFNVETNGCQLIDLIEKVDKNKNIKYILSPKLFTIEDFEFYVDLTNKIKDNSNVYIKQVYEDRELVIKFLDHLKNIDFENDRIYLMPEGKTFSELLSHAPIVFDAAEKYKTNFSSREHIIYNFT